MIAQEYPLRNGQRLRIATSAIRIGEGVALTSQGVKPDIIVEVGQQDEVAYYADAYRELTRTNSFRSTGQANANLSGTNRVRRTPFNEAELVRQRREGFSTEGELNSAQPDSEIEKPLVRDPVLARALDVLKGLAVVRRAKL
jgi:C-terminal processing protease CtpA/Prc